MVPELKKLIGFDPPTDLIEVVLNFKQKFGSLEKGIYQLTNYLRVDYFIEVKEGNSYEGTPIEAELFISTGGDGVNIGSLNLMPENPTFIKPYISNHPGNGDIVFHGFGVKQTFRNIINLYHKESNFKEVDLEFLKEINLDPTNVNPIELSVNYKIDDFIPIPIETPKGFTYHSTLDGVGVLSKTELFNEQIHLQSKSVSSIEKLKLAETILDNFPATSLYILKNCHYYYFRSPGIDFLFLKDLLNLTAVSYSRIGKKKLAQKTNKLVEEWNL